MNLNETKVRIFNLALTKLGITLRLSTGTEDCEEANAFNAVWEQILNEVLELGEWKCARRRAVLQRDTDLIEDATQAEPVVITATAHNFENGNIVKISDVVGMTQLNGNAYQVKGVTTNTFQLWTEDGTAEIDGTAFDAYVSGGILWRVPAWDYSYAYRLPDDCIKVLQTGVDAGAWREEHNILLTNYEDEEVEILYICYLEDFRYFSPLLADAVATRLGSVCAPALKVGQEKQTKLDQEFAALLKLSKGQDASFRQEPDQGSQSIASV